MEEYKNVEFIKNLFDDISDTDRKVSLIKDLVSNDINLANKIYVKDVRGDLNYDSLMETVKTFNRKTAYEVEEIFNKLNKHYDLSYLGATSFGARIYNGRAFLYVAIALNNRYVIKINDTSNPNGVSIKKEIEDINELENIIPKIPVYLWS